MLKWALVATILTGFAAPATAQGVNTTTGKPVSASGEPVSTSRPPPPTLRPAISTLSSRRRLGSRPLHRNGKLSVTPP